MKKHRSLLILFSLAFLMGNVEATERVDNLNSQTSYGSIVRKFSQTKCIVCNQTDGYNPWFYSPKYLYFGRMNILQVSETEPANTKYIGVSNICLGRE